MPASIFLLSILMFLFTCCCCSSSPQHADDHLIIRTTEKLPVHSEVINLRRLFFPTNNSTSATTADFSLAKRDDFPYLYFLINHSSRGILTIRKEIDRDELCRLRRCRCDTWCDLELEIIINSEHFNVELITIRIIDRNDHKPIFTNNQLNLTIVENAPIGAMIKLETAFDHDQGQNGIVGYSLISSTYLPFSLRYDLKRADLALVVEKLLDREFVSSYKFDVIARDGDNQTGVLHVFVLIDDLNDCPPKFDRMLYTIENISETISIDSIIGRVHARDDDVGVNGEITYHLVNRDDCFRVDQNTGDVRVRCLLDYEKQTTHRLEVEARDGGEGSKTDYCTVLIQILDENDNAPRIDIYPHVTEPNSNLVRLFLKESLPLNSVILSFAITDRDSENYGRVSWQLDRTFSIPFELVRLTDNTGEIRTKALLDREYISEYNLTLKANDHGQPVPKWTYLNIQITIVDVNDNVPTFPETHMKATISEHVKFAHSSGYDIFHLHAQDADQGLNGEIIYSLINNNENLFQIDSKSGIIRARKGFDRKQQDTYVLQVEARDKGTPSLSSRGTVTFTVISGNVYFPVCDMNRNIPWSIMENSRPGSIVGTLTCQDDDQDEPNSRISVHTQWFAEENIKDRNKYLIPFDVLTKRSNSSQSTILITIVVNGSIDREMISYYPLLLTIADHGNPPHALNVSILIEVLDENDHCPQLHIESTFLMINRDITPHDYLMHLIAFDYDQDLNGNITFELSPLTSPLFVHLYPNGTLLVQTKSELVAEDALVVLHVQIRDHGQPTPCSIVETLRLFIGSNRTDWITVLKNQNYDDTAVRLAKEDFQQGKRMANGYLIPSPSSSSSVSSPLFQYASAISSRKQIFAVFLGSSILMFIVILTMVLCFIDCLNKKSKQNRLNKANTIVQSSSMLSSNDKYTLDSLPIQTHNFYAENTSPPHYQSFKSIARIKPVVIAVPGNSHSTSSIDSTTRANTAHNRAIISTYTYTALSTSDDLLPVDFDDNTLDDNGIELMMTTV